MEYEVGKKFEEHEALINYILQILQDKGLIKTSKEDEGKNQKLS